MTNNNVEKDILTIPILDGTNYGEWSVRVTILLRSKELLDVCKKEPQPGVSAAATNRWTKASYNAVNLITACVSHKVLIEVIKLLSLMDQTEGQICIKKGYQPRSCVDGSSLFLLSRNQLYECLYWGFIKNPVSYWSRDSQINLQRETIDPRKQLICNCNLVSLLQLFDKKLVIRRCKRHFTLESKGSVIVKGSISNNLMKVKYLISNIDPHYWHQRRGHPGPAVLKSMGPPSDMFNCQTFGPITPPSVSGYQYFLTIVNQFTSFKITCFLKNKSNAFNEFLHQKISMENLHDRTLKKLLSDRGGEFLNHMFKALYEKCGFQHGFSPAETPQHNEFVERENQSILLKTRCILNHSDLPKVYWEEAV
ncbi:hypothetical protein O181_034643 [Austropuccinia psidii MF-1]|uniref:Integrase catalytic domain-containing protein n=1 Tax=Austropuccinia psidii MF-1 TaxID=1389203 RepID=A0A9Q3D3W5_9BASI|nr:hypothetical protein [Austropuccinia psidii MF-1]